MVVCVSKLDDQMELQQPLTGVVNQFYVLNLPKSLECPVFKKGKRS